MLFVNMALGGGDQTVNSDAELLVDDSAEVLEDISDDKITDSSNPNIKIVACEDQASHSAFCGRCRSISSSFLGSAFRPRTPPSHFDGVSDSCRYDQSIQQYYSAPDDIPLVNVRFRFILIRITINLNYFAFC